MFIHNLDKILLQKEKHKLVDEICGSIHNLSITDIDEMVLACESSGSIVGILVGVLKTIIDAIISIGKIIGRAISNVIGFFYQAKSISALQIEEIKRKIQRNSSVINLIKDIKLSHAIDFKELEGISTSLSLVTDTLVNRKDLLDLTEHIKMLHRLGKDDDGTRITPTNYIFTGKNIQAIKKDLEVINVIIDKIEYDKFGFVTSLSLKQNSNLQAKASKDGTFNSLGYRLDKLLMLYGDNSKGVEKQFGVISDFYKLLGETQELGGKYLKDKTWQTSGTNVNDPNHKVQRIKFITINLSCLAKVVMSILHTNQFVISYFNRILTDINNNLE